ncbi:MAG: pitrilysin family protein [Pseudomonadota bacterium]
MSRSFAALLSAAALVACGTPEPSDPYAEMNVTVHDGTFATIQQFETPGGVSVWLVEEPSIPILSLRMAWQTGSTTDPDGLEGLTQSMVYQMNEGAGELDSLAFFKRMEELNMSFGCSASRDSTFCNASMLTDAAEASFDLIGLAYRAPRFDDGPWSRFIREQEVSLATRETNAGFLAARATRDALYPGHPYARDISADSLAALSVAAAKGHKDMIMTKEGLLVTAVGAISPQALAPLIDKAIEGLPESSAAEPVETVSLAPAPDAPLLIDLPQPQSLVRFTAPAMPRDNPDFYPAIVVNYTLGGGGFESRLMEDLREEKGLTYGVSTSLNAGRHLQTWSGGGQTKNESASDFIDGVKANIALMGEAGLTQDELAGAKAFLTGSYPLGFDSNAKIAGNMMSVRLDGLGVDFFDKRNALVEAVTLEEVNRVAATYLDPDRFTFVVVGEPQGLK